ncbi:MAG: SPOR domain-containing protein [Candidatus Omnitrophica bacterium]|nr:SPOR domain-containing protein [Candidatus Omnitrophota bacterium]
MPLFRKPKEENLKSLSEKDIQQRLYGFFHQDRAVQVAPPPTKKSPKSTVDLRSVEVTPAGIIQTDLFRSQDSTTRSLIDEDKKENVMVSEKYFEAKRPVFSPEIEASSDVEELVKKTSSTVRKTTTRKTKKDKKRSDTFKKISIFVLEGLVTGSKTLFLWVSRGFSSFVLWLSESRGSESRRVPAKFILVSLAVIGTGLIFFNVWSTRMKQHSGSASNHAVRHALPKSVATRIVPVSSDALSKPQEMELIVPTQQAAVVEKKYFSIQVCVAQSSEGAATIVRKLRAGGLPAFYDAGSGKRGSRIYKIMLGKFETFQSAKQQLEAFKKTRVMEPYQDSFIRNLTAQR